MNKQRAVFLMLFPDKCWHDKPSKKMRENWPIGGTIPSCKKCGKSQMVWGSNPDLTTWQGFGLMWEAAQKAEWWPDFLEWIWVHDVHPFLGRMNIGVKFIGPEVFMNLLYEFGVASERIKEVSE